MDLVQVWDKIFNFSNYFELLPLVYGSLLVAFFLGFMGGLIGVFVVTRDLAFAVHGISELSFAGAAAALLFGVNIVFGSIFGSLIAALLFGLFGLQDRGRNFTIGIIMPFGLGLGLLFLALYEGRAANKFSLLTGQIISVSDMQVWLLLFIAVFVSAVLVFLWRPLMFASVDPVLAQARAVPIKTLSLVFIVILGLAVASTIQIVGALLVLSLLVTPAAAAMKLSSTPFLVVVFSVCFALFAVLGGILLSLGAAVPVSPYVTTISFLVYLGACGVAGVRRKFFV